MTKSSTQTPLREAYTRAYRLLRTANKSLAYAPRHKTFWGSRILAFQDVHPRAMQQAQRSFEWRQYHARHVPR